MLFNEFEDYLRKRIRILQPNAGSVATATLLCAVEMSQDRGGLENAVPLIGFGPHGGRNIDGYMLDEISEGIYLLTWVLVEGTEIGSPVGNDRIYSLCEECGSTLDLLRKKGHELGGPLWSEDNKTLAREWQSRLRDKSIEQFRLIIVTTGLCNMEFYQAGAELFGGMHVGVEVVDAKTLQESIERRLPYIPHKTDFVQELGRPVGAIKVPLGEADYEAYMLFLSGKDLACLYQRHGQALLEMNVRSYLELRSKVNKGIHATIAESPSRFFAYNNGLTMTAESLELDDGGIKSAVGLQIVNGGQTIVTIHRAFVGDSASHRQNVERIFVPAKLVVPKSVAIAEEIAAKVSKYANTQNKVTEADFTANDSLQIGLEAVSRKTPHPMTGEKWYYERHRGDYLADWYRIKSSQGELAAIAFSRDYPESQVLVKTDLSRVWMAWLGKPHVACLGAQKCFVQFAKQANSRRDLAPDTSPFGYKKLVGLVLIDRCATDLAKELGIASYRSFIAAYAVALLGQRSMFKINLEECFLENKAPSEIQRTLKKWLPEIFRQTKADAGDANYGEYLKKEASWGKLLRSGLFELDGALSESIANNLPEANVGEAAAETVEEQMLRARIMSVRVETLLEIAQKNDEGGWLVHSQPGILDTITHYARGGWKKVPSAAQVRSMEKILMTAESHGVYIPIEYS